jgi:hypothetical protein
MAPAPAEALRVVQPQPVYMPQLTESQMADLTASIALYPDPLLAVMLPAATSVEELTYADRWQEQHPGADERAIDSLPVEDSVKAMMHYPSALDVMIGHLDWTQSLGIAFTYQRQDLFDSIQRWRSTAVSNGYLFSGPQQEVLQQGTVILIQPPPRTQVVYVPVYDPAIVYLRPRPMMPIRRDVITFGGNGFALSFALNDVDWHDHEVRIPRRDAPRDVRGGPGDSPRGGPPSGRGISPVPSGRAPVVVETKTVFVPKDPKPGLAYPQKAVTPQPDKKVVTLPSSGAGRGPGGPGGPGGSGTPGRGPTGNGRGPGGGDN